MTPSPTASEQSLERLALLTRSAREPLPSLLRPAGCPPPSSSPLPLSGVIGRLSVSIFVSDTPGMDERTGPLRPPLRMCSGTRDKERSRPLASSCATPLRCVRSAAATDSVIVPLEAPRAGDCTGAYVSAPRGAAPTGPRLALGDAQRIIRSVIPMETTAPAAAPTPIAMGTLMAALSPVPASVSLSLASCACPPEGHTGHADGVAASGQGAGVA